LPIVKVDKGFFNLPKEIIIEALIFQNVYLKYKNGSGRGEFYYECHDKNCPYKLKITEFSEKLNFLTTASLIQGFKTFSLSEASVLETGISKIMEFRSILRIIKE